MRQLKLCSCLILILLIACDNAFDEKRDLLKGRTPEAYILVSGIEWDASDIGIVILDNDSVGLVGIEALSPSYSSDRQVLSVGVSNSANDRQPFSAYNFMETTAAFKVSGRIGPQYSANNTWMTDSNESAGLEITSIEVEDGRTYASGRFFANVYNTNLFPRDHRVEGRFSNVWVFDNAEERRGYFLQSQANRNKE